VLLLRAEGGHILSWRLAAGGRKIFFCSGYFLREAQKKQRMRKWSAHTRKQKAHR